MRCEIRLIGNKKISARMDNFEIITDQFVESGDESSAPSPFDLYLASMGTCAGHYVNEFCKKRKIPTENIKIFQDVDYDSSKKLISKVSIIIHIPGDFPKKYINGLVNAAEICTVKRSIQNPPKFEIKVRSQQD